MVDGVEIEIEWDVAFTVTSVLPVGSQISTFAQVFADHALILSVLAMMPSSEPYSLMSFTAVFGPTLSTPARCPRCRP